MRASEVLQKCLQDSLGRMHGLRAQTLLRSVEALLEGSQSLADPKAGQFFEALISS
ncbi:MULTISPECIES: hypothetical protein [unclassified Pseudoxanthomonas]|uniref:hypothetical protein n=1 Tax=unclassified Pseudoxanthomonas TaxID=2645906 RepID=UPI0030769FDE